MIMTNYSFELGHELDLEIAYIERMLKVGTNCWKITMSDFLSRPSISHFFIQALDHFLEVLVAERLHHG